LAQEAPERVLTTLAHHMDVAFLREAYRLTRKDGAVGVDGQTSRDYSQNLETNLASLLERFKSGSYYAPPVRRVYLPKEGSGAPKPIGIPSFEDKVLQRAVAMVLEAVYEQDFVDCSYGCQPRRSAHQALDALWQQVMQMGGGWVITIDIQTYFDAIGHSQLRRVLDKRVRDGVIRRTIDKWLKAGVLEAGSVRHPDTGVPQGSGVGPILSNLVLHEVLDHWLTETVKPRLAEEAALFRFADDALIVCASHKDAQRIMAVLPKRFGKYGLTLHPHKTRVIRFTRPPRHGRGERRRNKEASPGTVDWLGLTHYCGRSQQGNWVVKRKTAKARLSRALQRIHGWCKRHRHRPLTWQHQQLVLKLRGHYSYYGITGNARRVQAFRYEVSRRWRIWLDRRSQRRRMRWERFNQLLKHYPLPVARIVHSTLST
jgi:group II intron reverse transcriptase/maturase